MAGSLCSRDSLVLAAPSSVASSLSAERDRRSRSHRIGESTEARSCTHSSQSSPSRGRESREGRRCGHLRSGGSRGRSRALVPRTVCGLVDRGAPAVTCLAPLLTVCGLGGPGRSLRTATGLVGCSRGLDECARIRLAVARPGVTSPSHTGHVTVLPSLRIVRGLESGVVGLGGVAGITWGLWPPGVAATLGRGWILLLWLRGLLYYSAHALLAGHRQVVPQPV